MAAECGYGDSDDWELIYDDGFVYKRKKRPFSESVAAPPPPGPEVGRKRRRERRKRILMKLRDTYLKEISMWKIWSNKLKEMDQHAHSLVLEHQELHYTTSLDVASCSAPDSVHRKPIDDLLFQIEAKEDAIQGISNLCDVAEAWCSAQEESSKHLFVDLPIWGSPRRLMAALGDQ